MTASSSTLHSSKLSRPAYTHLLPLQAAEAASAAAAAGASAASEGEHAALAQRCKDLEKKFAVARKKIQV